MAAVAAVGEVRWHQIAEVVAAFDVGAPTEVRPVPEGLMNRNWRVTTPGGVYALKQVQDADPAQVMLLHAATTGLAARGLPVPAPMATADGRTLVEHADLLWTLTPWILGAHRGGLDLDATECHAVGRLLAALHGGLDEVMPPAPVSLTVPVATTGATCAAVDRYLQVAAQHTPQDEFDLLVGSRLVQRRVMLAELGHLRPVSEVVAGSVGWVHGDFHALNLTFQSGQVAGVFDWDRIKVWPLAAEVVRAATLMFRHHHQPGLDLARVAAFVAGYRSRVRLIDADLDEAVHRRWWDQLCGLWHLKRHYDLGDTRCDHLFVSDSTFLAWWNAHREQVATAVTAR